MNRREFFRDFGRGLILTAITVVGALAMKRGRIVLSPEDCRKTETCSQCAESAGCNRRFRRESPNGETLDSKTGR